jgi:nucleoside-diphosphate-sugar epimerase
LRAGSATALVDRVQPERLLHLAWTTIPGRLWTSPANLTWAASTLELHGAFIAAGGVRAVYAGTCAEYDWSKPELNEHTPLRPTTYYGVAKAAASQLVLAAPVNHGPSVAWGRIFYLYGPGERPGRLVSDAVVALLEGRPVDCTEGKQERDFMHVADVARAFCALIDCDVVGPVDIASGICRPVREILGEIGRQLNRAELLQIGALPSPPQEPQRIATRALRLRDEVKFTAHYDLPAGIADTISWWRQHLAHED